LLIIAPTGFGLICWPSSGSSQFTCHMFWPISCAHRKNFELQILLFHKCLSQVSAWQLLIKRLVMFSVSPPNKIPLKHLKSEYDHLYPKPFLFMNNRTMRRYSPNAESW